MIKAVLFDLDGTLLDRDTSLTAFIEYQYNRFNLIERHIAFSKFKKRFIELDNNGYTWKDVVYQNLVNDFNLSPISEEELLSDYINNFSHCCIPFDNLNEMLISLKSRGYLLGIISNGKTVFQVNNIKALDIENFFDTILISEEEGIKKPDPQIFIKASTKLKVLPEECIYVGDHPINDVGGAYQAGMTGILKQNSKNDEYDTQYKIRNLIDLTFLINNF